MNKADKLFPRVLLFLGLWLVSTALPGRISVGINCNFPPYEYTDSKGRICGSDVDILKLIEKETPYRFKLVCGDLNILQKKINEGQIQMLAGTIKIKDSDKNFLYSIPYTYIHYSVFTRREYSKIKSWTDLNAKSIIMENGSPVEELLRQKRVSVKSLWTSSPEQAIQLLANGTGDAVIMPKIQGFYYMSRHQLDNLIEAYAPAEAFPYCFVVPVGFEGLLKDLNLSIQSLNEDYRLQKAQNKWLGIYNYDLSSFETQGRFFQLTVILMILALLVIAFFIYVFVKRIRQQRKYLELQMAERNNYEKEYYQRHQLFISGPIIFLKWNDAKRDMFESVSDNFSSLGYDPKDILSGKLRYRNIIHPDDLDRVLLERQQHFSRQEYSFNQIYRIICPIADAENNAFEVVNTWHNRNHALAKRNLVYIRWIYDFTVIMPDEVSGSQHYYGYILDITSQKRIESELQKQHQVAQVAINTKDIFLTSISIEINSPLNALIGLSRKISDHELSEDQITYLKIIADSAMHLKQILQQIHDFLSILKGSIGSIPQWYILKRLLEPIIDEFQIKIASKQLAFEHSEYQPAALVYIDADWFQKIIRIILDNAVKFTEEGKINLTVDLEIGFQDNGKIVITISDTGIGIPQDKLDLIMEPFTQADETFTRKFGGIGLGLSIARNLLVQMSGEISIISQKNEGTKVELRIPVRLKH
jgi:signal transduction histidine kinase/ABC-type amino acid transport substrate-binding protein